MKLILLIFCLIFTSIEAFGFDFSNIFGPGFPFNHGNSPFNNNFNNFGAQIQSTFDQSMQQVADVAKRGEATNAILFMVHGVGGSSKIVYNSQSVLVKDYSVTKCDGDITTNVNGFDLVCNGQSVPVDDDVCVPGASSFSQVNDVFCVFNKGSNSGFSVINGHISCENGQIYTKENLESKCGSNVLSENYAKVYYIPDVNNPQHIPIPSNNPHIPCKDKTSNICEFETSLSGFKNVWNR